MKLCPQCQSVYNDTEVFCMKDGNLLSVIPQFGGNPPPNQFNQPPTVQFGQSNIRSISETVTVVQPAYTPPTQPLPPPSNANKNIIIAVLAAVSILLVIGIFIVNSDKNSTGTDDRSSSNAEREGNSGANSSNGGAEDSSKSDDQDNIARNDKNRNKNSKITTPDKKPNDLEQTIPNGIKQQYSGSSRFPNKNLPLTLILTRNGQSLYGSAQTPGEWDDLSGTIQPDGRFTLRGNNQKAGRVTGIWSGRINENGQVSGVWTSTIDGSKISFSAR